MAKAKKRTVSARNRKKRNWFAPFGILSVLALTYLSMTSSFKNFSLTQMLTRAQIDRVVMDGLDMLTVPMVEQWSGLTRGKSANDIKNAAAHLISHPRVAKAVVAKDLLGRVRVEIQERQAVATVWLGKLYEVDAQGNLMDAVSTHQGNTIDGMPMITGLANKSQAKARVPQALALLEALSQVHFSTADTPTVHWDQRLGWVLYHARFSAPLIFGTDHFEKKAARAQTIIHKFVDRHNELEEVDLDFAQTAVVKMKEEVARGRI